MFSSLPTQKNPKNFTKDRNTKKDFVVPLSHVQIYRPQTPAKSLIDDVLATTNMLKHSIYASCFIRSRYDIHAP